VTGEILEGSVTCVMSKTIAMQHAEVKLRHHGMSYHVSRIHGYVVAENQSVSRQAAEYALVTSS
jgi:hypothetical protein